MKLTSLYLAATALTLSTIGGGAAQAATPAANSGSAAASAGAAVPGGEMACIAAYVWFDGFLADMRVSAGTDQKQLTQVDELIAGQPRGRAMFQGRLTVLKDDGRRQTTYAALTADLNKLDRTAKLQRVVDCKKWELELTKQAVGSMVPPR